MRKIFTLAIAMLLCWQGISYSSDQWAKGQLDGDISISDIDAYNQVNNEAQDRLLFNYRQGCECVADSASQITVLAGEVAIPNAGGTVVKYRKNTSSTTVTFSDLDTGSEGPNQYYYVYTEGDTNQATFDIVISTSSSAPSEYTYYKKIGWFYNDSSGDIAFVGNIKESGVLNIVKATGTDDISTTSAAYEDMADMEIHFVANGRPVKIQFLAPAYWVDAGSIDIYTVIDIDGTDYGQNKIGFCTSAYEEKNYNNLWLQDLAAGTHTIKIQWKKSGTGTAAQRGATDGYRILIVSEK